MTRDEVFERLRGDRDALGAYRVRSRAVFGLVVRGEMREGSDVDILVEFESSACIGLFEFVRLQRHVAELLGALVDLVTPAALRHEFRESILRVAVHAA